ncbi:MAG: polysaccharide biosynthesis tyrosine autokinase [Planctomycetes bacterium]|nr:polysaccharide biosynthesis tyrosine autokinase [Planctomycetota bacterium]
MTQNDPIRLPQIESQSQGNEADPGRMLQILWRGKWILLAVPLLAFGAAKLWLDGQTEFFSATARVQVDAREVNPLKAGAGEAINKPRTVLKQQQGLIKSTPLLRRVAESPALAGMKTFAPERLNGTTVIGALNENLQTNIDVESDLLLVSFLSPYREEAVAVVDEALRVYIEYHKEKKRAEATELAEIVRKEWQSAITELDEVSAKITKLQSDNGLLAGEDRSPLQTKLDNANAALNLAHLETQKLFGVYEEMRLASQDPAPERLKERGLYWRSKSPVAMLEERGNTLRSQREQKEEELTRREAELGPANPKLASLREAIAKLRAAEDQLALDYAQHYLQSTLIDWERARLNEQSLAADQQALLAQVTSQNAVIDQIKNLSTAREELRLRVATFNERIKQLEVLNDTGALNLDVIEYARAGVRPTYPEVEKTYIYALGAGGILAFGLVLLLGLADRRVRDVEDVPKLLGMSVLGVLPELPHGANRVKIARSVEEDPHSLVAEAIRSVRTATIFALPGGRGVVLVTSASADEGKTVCASNLAFALAGAGKKTLLIDADMRKPAQHQIYSIDNGLGLAGLLTSAAAVKKAIVPSVAHGLDLLPAGDARGKAAELCEGAALTELVRALRESYECIVIDSPPVLETSEARVLAAMADATVFVLRLEVSRAPNLKRAAGILRGVGARILGALPNCSSSKRGARAYSGGISYGPGGPSAPATHPRGGDESEAKVPDPKARGTDFLGLEEESA